MYFVLIACDFSQLMKAHKLEHNKNPISEFTKELSPSQELQLQHNNRINQIVAVSKL